MVTQMSDKILVHVDDQPLELFRGMQAKHALISLDQSLCKAAAAGEIWLEDESGFRLGLEGALHDGARIYIRRKKMK